MNGISIQSMYNQYYYPTVDIEQLYSVNNSDNNRGDTIDGVMVNIEYFHIEQEQIETMINNDIKSKPKQQQQERIENNRFNINHNYGPWNWISHIPRNQRQENDELATAIALSLNQQYFPSNNYFNNNNNNDNDKKKQKLKNLPFVSTTVSVYGNNINYPQNISHHKSSLKYDKIADKAWNVYKNNLNIINITKNDKKNWIRDWKITERGDIEDSIGLEYILDSCISYLWPMYHIIFAFIGYNSLMISKVKATLSFIKPKICHHGPQNNGIIYHEERTYDKRRRYSDYIKDIESYIPTYIYYKTTKNIDIDGDNKYLSIGEYNKYDWNELSYFIKRRKRKTPYKKKKNDANIDIKGIDDNNKRILYSDDGYPRCPCGCNRKVTKYNKHKTLVMSRGCVDNKRGWRWKGYKRNIFRNKTDDRWWKFHENAIKIYANKFKNGRKW